MQAEIIYARGLSVFIDGIEPAKGGWSYDIIDEGYFVISELSSDLPVKIGEHQLTGIAFDKPWWEIEEDCKDPTTMFLYFRQDDGMDKEIQLHVTAIASDKHVTMVDGSVRFIDETSYYVRASTECADQFVDPLDEVADWRATIRFDATSKRSVIELIESRLDDVKYEITKG